METYRSQVKRVECAVTVKKEKSYVRYNERWQRWECFSNCGKTDEFVKRKSRCSNDHFFLSCTLKTTPLSCGKNFLHAIFVVRSPKTHNSIPGNLLKMRSHYWWSRSSSSPTLEQEREGKIETTGRTSEIAVRLPHGNLGRSQAKSSIAWLPLWRRPHQHIHTYSRLQEGNTQLVGACAIRRKLGYSVLYIRPRKGNCNRYRPAFSWLK